MLDLVLKILAIVIVLLIVAFLADHMVNRK